MYYLKLVFKNIFRHKLRSLLTLFGLVVAILAFVGTKMIISDWYHVPTAASLGVVAAILIIAIGVSALFRRADEEIAADGEGHEIAHEPLLAHPHD